MTLRERIRSKTNKSPMDDALQLVADSIAMRNSVAKLMKDTVVVPEPETLTVTPDCFAAMIAAGYTLVRQQDKDWSELDRDKAINLYLGVAMSMLHMMYRKDSVVKQMQEEINGEEADGDAEEK